MKFYGNGVVWNPSNNSRLCSFKDGELETEDQTIIDQLIDRGYDRVQDGEPIPLPSTQTMGDEAADKGDTQSKIKAPEKAAPRKAPRKAAVKK